jgi:predicted Zn-dependent protease with MMP-like domain
LPIRPRTSSSRVRRHLEAALDELPEQYAALIENLSFHIARAIMPRDRRRLELGNDTLYGLYEGVPITGRTSGYDRVLPDRITLYWGPLVRDFPDEAELADQVRKTVYHEIAHYFGLSDDDLMDTRVH